MASSWILDTTGIGCQTQNGTRIGLKLDPRWDNLWIRKETTMLEATIEETTEEEEIQPQWELAECTCPDYCERDHEQD